MAFRSIWSQGKPLPCEPEFWYPPCWMWSKPICLWQYWTVPVSLPHAGRAGNALSPGGGRPVRPSRRKGRKTLDMPPGRKILPCRRCHRRIFFRYAAGSGRPRDIRRYGDLQHGQTTTFNGLRLPAIALWDSASDERRICRTFGYEDFQIPSFLNTRTINRTFAEKYHGYTFPVEQYSCRCWRRRNSDSPEKYSGWTGKTPARYQSPPGSGGLPVPEEWMWRFSNWDCRVLTGFPC